MLFTQPRTAAGQPRWQAMTRELIDAAPWSGGRYYLPYRLHATGAVPGRVPAGCGFFELKRRYDPQDVPQPFYDKYGAIR